MYPVQLSSGCYQLASACISGDKISHKVLETGGTKNIQPALLRVGDRVAVVWESNEPGLRSIEFAWLNPEGSLSGKRRLSKENTSNANPAIAATASGDLLVVWDSFREKQFQ